jgi:hypothetical protein
MIVGLSIATYTLTHVIISLIAIISGVVVLFGMIGSRPLPGWTALFLTMTILTSVGGFLFPFNGFTPAIGVGIISLIVLVVALLARYAKNFYGRWRWIYVLAVITALYFNVAVLVIQSFQKVSFLNPAAPVVGPPFAEPVNSHFVLTQAIVLAVFVVVGIAAFVRFRPSRFLAH